MWSQQVNISSHHSKTKQQQQQQLQQQSFFLQIVKIDAKRLCYETTLIIAAKQLVVLSSVL